jgi:hypothetical protein
MITDDLLLLVLALSTTIFTAIWNWATLIFSCLYRACTTWFTFIWIISRVFALLLTTVQNNRSFIFFCILVAFNFTFLLMFGIFDFSLQFLSFLHFDWWELLLIIILKFLLYLPKK